MSDLIELGNKVVRLTKLLSEAKAELYLARQDEIGVHVGDMVKGSKSGKLFRVEGLDFSYGHKKPWIRGRVQKKDGGLALNRTHLFEDWEKI